MIHVALAVGLIALVLLQQGKGADAGAAFGGGASGTVFGAQGSATFLSKFTGILAALFFCTSLSLAYFANTRVEPKSVTELVAPVVDTEQVPTEPKQPSDLPNIPD